METTTIKTTFELPILPYAANKLEPFIDQKTMEIHYEKHHGGYVNNLKKAVEGTDAAHKKIEDILKKISDYSTAVRNNAGGHYNHSLFWTILTPDSEKTPTGTLMEAIEKNFNTFDKFKSNFEQAAMSVFGSGWAWLVVKNNELLIGTTPNQDNPLMDISNFSGTPILGLDVWEHAYYLNYQNRRPDYISAFWNVVNWEEVSRRLKSA